MKNSVVIDKTWNTPILLISIVGKILNWKVGSNEFSGSTSFTESYNSRNRSN